MTAPLGGLAPGFVGERTLSLIFGVTLAMWAAIEIRQALRRRTEATNEDRGSRLVVQLCACAGVLLAAVARKANATAFPHGAITFSISLALIWAGIGLRWWSFRALGQYFTFNVMTSADQQVVSAGPYRFLRHPSYAAILLILIGIGVSYGNWLSLAALIGLALIGFLNRIRVEEAALTEAIGTAYTRYASTRKRIVPFVW